MRSPTFYEFTGIIVPGAVLLVAVGLIFDVGSAEQFVVPDSAAGAIVYLVLAYVFGHLIAGVANCLEAAYWRPFGGKPEEWPVPKHKRWKLFRFKPWKKQKGKPWKCCVIKDMRKELPESKQAVRVLTKLCGEAEDSPDPVKWKRMIWQARASIYAHGRGDQLNIFTGNYGLFRGLAVTELIIATFVWHSEYIQDIFGSVALSLMLLYIIGVVVFVLTLLRLHRFEKYYADELFANAADFVLNSPKRDAHT
ncbi:MAG: hypothetical protein IH963_10960 [Chloroflexi bacterium]|nr:hypothetical protein [Chloroflexota bacterium]